MLCDNRIHQLAIANCTSIDYSEKPAVKAEDQDDKTRNERKKSRNRRLIQQLERNEKENDVISGCHPAVGEQNDRVLKRGEVNARSEHQEIKVRW